MKSKISVALCLVVFSIVCLYGLAWGQANEDLMQKSRPAKASDIAGEWVMTYQTVRPSIKNNSLFFADYQVFCFLNNGFAKNVASTAQLNSQDVKMYLQTMPEKTTYSFVADGLLIIERSQQDFDNIVISIITDNITEKLQADAPLLEKGDLILTYLDPNKKPYMQRYLRKIDLGQ